MAAALLLPEVGHNFAHHHAAEHRLMRMDGAHDADVPADGGYAVFPEEHGHRDHPHLELLATSPTKPLLGHTAVIVRVAALLLSDLHETRPLAPVEPTGLSPGDWAHGSSPPTRAPPQV